MKGRKSRERNAKSDEFTTLVDREYIGLYSVGPAEGGQGCLPVAGRRRSRQGPRGEAKAPRQQAQPTPPDYRGPPKVMAWGEVVKEGRELRRKTVCEPEKREPCWRGAPAVSVVRETSPFDAALQNIIRLSRQLEACHDDGLRILKHGRSVLSGPAVKENRRRARTADDETKRGPVLEDPTRMYVGGVKPAPPATMRGAPLCRCGLPPAAELQPNVSPIPGLTSPSLARLVGTLDSIEFSIEPAREAELSPVSAPVVP